ncbi:MAG: hypothetical protein GX116_09195 [Fibrobacter sp.]|nr:hypothetical protein [Fibrobacter sp.]
MNRTERRRHKKKSKNFVPKKSQQLDKNLIIILASIAVLFFIGTTLIKYST